MQMLTSEKLNYMLEKNNIFEILEILGNKRKIFIRNLIAGISKGIGIGIGFTVLSAILIIILQKIKSSTLFYKFLVEIFYLFVFRLEYSKKIQINRRNKND